MARNQLTTQYFDSHITPCQTSLQRWNDGISFTIYYNVTIGWVKARLYDTFIIWLSPSTTGLYPSLNVPRGVLLTEEQVNIAIQGSAFGSHLNKVSYVNNLKFEFKKDAMDALLSASKADSLCNWGVYYKNSSYMYPSNGHPFLGASAVMNWSENKCLEGEIDLVTGDVTINPTVCYILFCFAEGTQITLKNGLTKPIENIKIGDTILSANMNSKQVEEDIVLHIDSPNHQDIVQLLFSDSTRNENTFDHPYFVKGKGWCSYKPLETSKYKMHAKQLQVGDVCLKYQNGKLQEVQLKKITEQPKNIKTHNLTHLKQNNSYFANGLLVSNESADK